jgi:hypothetical protein
MRITTAKTPSSSLHKLQTAVPETEEVRTAARLKRQSQIGVMLCRLLFQRQRKSETEEVRVRIAARIKRQSQIGVMLCRLPFQRQKN